MLKTVFTQSRKQHWRHALLSIGFYIMGTLLPVWLSLFLLRLFSQPIGFGTFLDEGQFAIYSAAALAPILYSLSKQGSGQERTLYQLLIMICLMLAAGTFSGLTVVESLTIGQLHVDILVLRISSIAIYGLALVATFFLDLHENVYGELNVAEERSHRQDRLGKEFDLELRSLEDDTA